MADKQITELPASAGITNETQFPAYQPGASDPAQKVSGAQIAAFAEAQANEAATEAGRAAGAEAGAEAGRTAGATAGAEAGAEAAAEAGAEAGRTAGAEAGKTAGTTAGATAGAEAGKTAGTEAGAAAGKTAGAEAGKTAGAEAGTTAGTTAGTAAGKTAGAEAGKTAGATAGSEAGAEAGRTAGAEAGAAAGATAGEQAAGNLQRGATFTPCYDSDSNTLSWTNDLGLPNPDPVELNIDTVSRLATPRNIQTKLDSTTAASFDGSADVTPGVTGVLPLANGGTGATTAAAARTNLGITLANLGAAASSHTHAAGDVTSGTLPVSRGGTGNTTGLAASATKLATARTIQTNLASTSTASFDGSANVTLGVTGTLPVANGGTGATTAAGALSNLGAVNKSGDTMNGNLVVNKSGYPSVSLTNTSGRICMLELGQNGDYLTLANKIDNSNRAVLRLYNENKSLSDLVLVSRILDGVTSSYSVLHTGNVVTGTYTGTGVVGTYQDITVGFEPSAVFILRADGTVGFGLCVKSGDNQGKLTSAKMSTASNAYTVFNDYLTITSTGFSVLKYHVNYENSPNEASVTYTYFAIL